MSLPTDYRFTADHEWVNATEVNPGDVVRVGITDVATEALGDVVFVELPEVGASVTAGVACGEVESTKTVSDLVAPVSGEVVAVNEELTDNPGVVNEDPYEGGWMFEVKVESAGDLLEAEDYQKIAAQ